jgi:hypothetical protein
VISELRTKAKIEIRDPALLAALPPGTAATAPPAAAPAPAVAAAAGPIADGDLLRKRDGDFTTFGNRDLYGGDLRTLKNVPQQACSAACQNDASCKAFSYDRWNRWCFLKSSVGELALEPASISGVKTAQGEPVLSTAAVRIERRLAKGYAGPHTRSNAASSPEQCEDTCQLSKDCIGFTYSKAAKTCKTFDRIDRFGPEANAISGHKTQTPP